MDLKLSGSSVVPGEGDDVLLSYVTCPRVSGTRVVIGKGCEIDLVQYSETVEISPGAKVRKIEKI